MNSLRKTKITLFLRSFDLLIIHRKSLDWMSAPQMRLSAPWWGRWRELFPKKKQGTLSCKQKQHSKCKASPKLRWSRQESFRGNWSLSSARACSMCWSTLTAVPSGGFEGTETLPLRNVLAAWRFVAPVERPVPTGACHLIVGSQNMKGGQNERGEGVFQAWEEVGTVAVATTVS